MGPNGTEPFSHDGGEVGVLVLHGFTGSPKSMRPWAEHLAGAGLSVRLPRLPGHGTSIQDANRSTWADWYGEARRAFDDLDRQCSEVFVAGLSMGGSLALRLAEDHGDGVRGLVLVNPAVRSENRLLPLLPVLQHVLPSVPGLGNDIAKPGQDEGCYDRVPVKALHSLVAGWRDVRSNIARVVSPLLLFRSRVDHVVEPSNEKWILENVSSTDVTEHVLDASFHVATLDYDAPTIFRESLEFVDRLSIVPRPVAAPVTGPAEPSGQE